MQLRRIVFAGLIALAVGLWPQPGKAFNLLPMSADLTPSGTGAATTFRVVNTSTGPIAVQMTMMARQMGLDGSDALTDAEEDFLLFPPQMVLQAGESQVVRLQWIGDPAPTQELAYRIIAEQVPVALQRAEPGRGNITILIRYEGSVYVVPSGAAPNVAVESAEAVQGDSGERQLAVTLTNSGTAHTLLRETQLAVSSNDGTQANLSGEQLSGLEGANILAGATRRFLLPWPDGLGDAPLQASLDFTSRR